MSCQANTIPAPPTTLPSCAVPIGGSNSSLLDTCCNGHINAMATYSAPNTKSNAKSDDGCFQFCVTDNPENVRTCLFNTLGAYKTSGPMFECFNEGAVKKQGGKADAGVYSNTGMRIAEGGKGWKMGVVLMLGFVGAIMGGA